MKRFGQFLRERESGINLDDGLTAILKMVAAEHKGELMAWLDELAVSDHHLRDRLEAYRQKDGKDDNLPPSGPHTHQDEIVPSMADGGAGDTEEDN